MAHISLQGKVFYMPGPWGMAVPATGVSLSVFDKDIGNADDLIWSGSTDAKGAYQGTSSDWRDSRTVSKSTPLGTVSTTVADLSDVMALYVTVKQRIANRDFDITLPYVLPPLGLPAPPIVLSWGPPGRTRVRVNQAPVPTVAAFASLMQNLFGSDATLAAPGVAHEICIWAEQAATLKAVMQSLESGLAALQAQGDALRRRSTPGQVGAGSAALARQAGSAIGSAVRQTAAATGGSAAAGFASSGTRPDASAAGNGLEAVRQQLIAFVHSIEAASTKDAQVNECNRNWSVVRAVVMVVVAICTAVISSLMALSVASLTVALLVTTAVMACVSATATIVANLPAFLAACGFTDAASDMSNWYQQNSWFGAMLTAVAVVCVIIILLASLPLAGWSWAMETIGSADGTLGLRFVIAR